MAEIKIEKKQPIWPWILVGLIILGVILYFILSDNDSDDMDDMDDNVEEVDTTYQDTQAGDRNTATWPEGENGAPPATANNESVNAYLSHVGNTSRMGLEHEYTNNALLHLVNAVDYKAQENNVNISTDLTEIRKDAEEIKKDPTRTDHANHIKNAATKLANAMEKIQKEKFPNLSQDISDVRTAAQGIDTSVLTLEQKDKINSFFNEAADVLRKMS